MVDTIDLGMGDEEIERDILRSFGWAIVEFEETLYHKYLMMSAPHSLLSQEQFNKFLKNMQAKGYIAPLSLLGSKAWKKLVVEDDIEDTLRPRRIRIATEQEARPTPARPRGFVVSESHIIASDILHTIENKLFPGQPRNPRMEERMKKHVSEMRRALTQSRNDFLDYLKKQAPTLKKPMELILSSKGENLLLVSLRLIESGAIEH
ncbi:MAG: hypothetical protein K9W43_02545 [Candidatus Thorarchaeota archaeon]|nr:hypothetical protein [Candidatus Thorarchaeota archaeon]